MSTPEKVTVRLRVGPFEVEASGQNQGELEAGLRTGVLALKPAVPLAQELESYLKPVLLPKEDNLASKAIPNQEILLSTGEFLKGAHVDTETDRCLAIAAHLFRNGVREFTHRDVLKAYDEAGLPYPTNVYDVLNRLVKKAHLRPCGDKEGVKCFAITRSGLEYMVSLTAPVPA